MKTIEDIKNEIDKLKEQIDLLKNTKREEKKIKNKIEQLKQLILYLELFPEKESVTKKLVEVERKINIINNLDTFLKWSSLETRILKNPRAVYKKEMELQKLIEQQKNLKFLSGT